MSLRRRLRGLVERALEEEVRRARMERLKMVIGEALNFQLHVSDSNSYAVIATSMYRLSTPCIGFCTMGGLVIVYHLVITCFHYVFYCCTPIFSPQAPHDLS